MTFYRCSVESIITYCICVWFSSCTAAERKALQQVVNSAQKIIGCPLPSLEELYNTRRLPRSPRIQPTRVTNTLCCCAQGSGSGLWLHGQTDLYLVSTPGPYRR